MDRDMNRIIDMNRSRDKAEWIIAVAEKAKEGVDELLEMVSENETLTVPENITAIYDAGVAKLEEAKAAEDPVTAIDLAREALTAFREVFKSLYRILRQAYPEIIREEASQALNTALDRAGEWLEKVNGLVAKMKEQGIDTSDAEAYLDEAAKTLDDAIQALSEGRISDAAHKLGDAHQLIAKALVSLKKGAGQLNAKRIPGFIEKQNKALEKIREHAEKRGWNLSPLQRGLEKASKMAREGDVKGAINQLQEVGKGLEEVQRGLKSPQV
jgi:flagellin-specific chaperone FliS